MSRHYSVRVKPDYRYAVVRVSGRNFSKQGEVLTEDLVNNEIRTSALLEVKLLRVKRKKEAVEAGPEVESPEEGSSKPRARLLDDTEEDG